MEESKKYTDKAGSSHRVVDMSWAADYLDDDWENKYASRGIYDTLVPAVDNGKGHAETAGEAQGADQDPMAATQEFSAKDIADISRKTSWNAGRNADLSVSLSKAADILRSSGRNAEANRHAEDLSADAEDDGEDIIKIRDALTDRTIVSVEEARSVRKAAESLQDDGEDILKIRDALTDRTIVSVEEARSVRQAAGKVPSSDDMEDTVKIRDAVTDKTIISSRAAAAVRSAAVQSEAGPKVQPSAPASPAPASASAAPSAPAAASAPAAPAASARPEETAPVTEKTIDMIPAARRKKTREPLIEEAVVWEEKKAPQEPEPEYEPENYDDRDGRYEYDDRYEDDDRDGYDDRYDRRGYDDRYERHAYDDRYEYDDRYDRHAYDDRYERRGYDDRYDRPARSGRYDREPDDYYDDGYDDYYDYRPSRSPLRFIPLVLVIALCVVAFITAKQICHDVPLNASDYSKVSYTVAEGLTDKVLAEDLVSLGIIENPLVFRLRCLFYSADYQPGTYELSPCYSTEKIVNILSGYKYGTDE